MLYFSSLLTTPEYTSDSSRLFEALSANGENFKLIENTKDILIRAEKPFLCAQNAAAFKTEIAG